MAPGIRADLVGRNTQAVGRVMDGTIAITAGVYKADVAVDTRFPGRTIPVKNVQFNMPVADGDVVSLQIMGGQPINGVFGTPVRPHGPNVLFFDGPTTSAEWAADTAAEAGYRAANVALESYVVPFDSQGNVNVNAPTVAGVGQQFEILFGLPDTIRILTKPAAAFAEISATLNGGLRIVGGPRGGDYAVRYPAGKILLSAIAADGSYNLAELEICTTIEAVRVSKTPVATRVYQGDSYPNLLNNSLKANGGHIIFGRQVLRNPEAVGGIFELAVFVSIPEVTDLEYRRQVIHPEHPARAAVGTMPVVPEHPEHPEHSFWIWDDLTSPQAGETFYLWLGLSDVQVNIVELGTGAAR